MNYRIYLSPPHQNGREREALLQSLESNWLAPVGPDLDAFEESLQKIMKSKPVLAMNSGTAAIHMALILAGVGTGDVVFVASHTHNATVNPIIYQGATPVFIDSEKETWNMSPDFLRKAIEEQGRMGKKPKAIILVHLYGMPAQLEEIIQICKEHDILIIEDAAEALGSLYQNSPLGTFGDFGILSFNGNKIVTSSGGGALICNSQEIRNRALYYSTQARDEAPHFQHSEIGYNYRMSNILAALGNAQLQNLDERVDDRRNNFDLYRNRFSTLNKELGSTVVTWIEDSETSFSNRWLSTFQVLPSSGVDSETWRLSLYKNGIESRPLWKPMHLQPVFKDYMFYGDHTSDLIFEQGICLPSGSDLNEKDIDEIVSIISQLYKS